MPVMMLKIGVFVSQMRLDLKRCDFYFTGQQNCRLQESQWNMEGFATFRATLKQSYYVSFCPLSAHPSDHKKTFPDIAPVRRPMSDLGLML